VKAFTVACCRFDNNIGTGDAGASAFADALRHNTSLMELRWVLL